MTAATGTHGSPPDPDLRLTWRRLFLSFNGRISRRTFLWRGQAVLSLVCAFGFVAIAIVVSLLRGEPKPNISPSRADLVVACFEALILLAFAWGSSALTVKRLHDRNRSGWWFLLLVALVVGVEVWIPSGPAHAGWLVLALLLCAFAGYVWITVETALMRGTIGQNRYGAAPLSFLGKHGAARSGDGRLPGWGGFFVDLCYFPTVIAAAIVVRSVAFEPFNIPGGSMMPTLLVGDYFFVSKYSYGYGPYSFSGVGLVSRSRILGAQPKRGDVVVFRLPRDPSVAYVKRVVGLGGDRVQMVGGRLFLNGTAVAREPLEDFGDSAGRIPRYRETLPEGVSYEILQLGTTSPMDNTPIFDVPPGAFFVLGDYRSNSLDSRVSPDRGVGFVPFENLIGRAEFRFYSDAGGAPAWRFWEWPARIRYERLFTEIR